MQNRIWLSLLVVVSVMMPVTIGLARPADAQTTALDPASVTAAAAVVIDMDSGKYLYSKDAAAIRPPASLTKLVTALVYFNSKPNLSKVVTINKSDQVGGASLSTKVGYKYQCKHLINASLIGSLNNVTHALSSCLGINEAAYISRMNKTAQSLGLLRTNFFDMTGLDIRNQTTAEEYSVILKAALQHKQIAEILQKSSYSFTAEKNKKIAHTVRNTDQLLSDPDVKVMGGKTGYIDESRYNFAAGFAAGQRRVLVVILGTANRSTSFAEAKQLALSALAN